MAFNVSVNENEHIRALKYDVGAMSYQEKMDHWNACVASRMNSIRALENSPKQIVDAWPQYKMADGFRLVCIVQIFCLF